MGCLCMYVCVVLVQFLCIYYSLCGLFVFAWRVHSLICFRLLPHRRQVGHTSHKHNNKSGACTLKLSVQALIYYKAVRAYMRNTFCFGLLGLNFVKGDKIWVKFCFHEFVFNCCMEATRWVGQQPLCFDFLCVNATVLPVTSPLQCTCFS